MSAVIKHLIPVAAAAALAACGGTSSNEAAANETASSAPTEIETLPPDESVATPTDELANGAVEPPVTNTAAVPPPESERLVAIKGSEPHD
ncbi:MAG: hypothetical protein M3Q52_08200 [Pseudomonadota bacterium]|nr:hypothetical protein [Pseudomonadota bacterium]